MFFQQIILIIILVLSSMITYSAPSNEQDIGPLSEQDIIPLTEPALNEQYIGPLSEQYIGPLSEQYIGPLNEQDIDPLSELDIASFFCPGPNRVCCPLLAHRIASKHHSRCSSIVLINNSGHTIFLVGSSLESGRWVTSRDTGDIDSSINCEPQISPLKDGQSEAFSAVTSHFLGGVQGFASFTVDDDNFNTFTIEWKVPLLGPPEYFFYGSTHEEYTLEFRYGIEMTVLQVTINQHFSLWSIFGLPFLLLPFAFCCCVIISISNGQQSKECLKPHLQQSYGTNECLTPHLQQSYGTNECLKPHLQQSYGTNECLKPHLQQSYGANF